MLTSRGFIDARLLANRLQKLTPPLRSSAPNRFIWLLMKDLNQFKDEQILELVRRKR